MKLTQFQSTPPHGGRLLIGTDADGDILKIDSNKDLFVTAGFVDAKDGFKDNGTAGVDGSFPDNAGNTITVSGGIITALT
jgi:hypothetical protein